MGNEQSSPQPSDKVSTILSTPPNNNKQRRIVKAVKPAPLIHHGEVSSESKNDNSAVRANAEEETRDNTTLISPQIRIQPKTKAKRQAKLQQHRNTPKHDQTASSPLLSSPPSPHPMSRFLSAFSVEPKHPEHKRRIIMDDTEIHKPSEKRLRPVNLDDDDDSENDDGDDENDKPFLVAWNMAALAATLVVGLAAIVLLRQKKH